MAFNPHPHLITMKGGALYLPVKYRLIWLREEHPDASVEVELTHLDLDSKLAVARATVMLPNGTKASDIGSETEKDFPAGWIEKAGTKAVGRALAALGFGTQFALELEEGERVVDSPVTTPAKNGATAAPADGPPAALATPAVSAAAKPADGPPAAPGDPDATLRAEVVAMLSEDGAALQLLQGKPGGKMPPQMSHEELVKTKTWLVQRGARNQPVSTRLSRAIAAATSAEGVTAAVQEAQLAKDRREITQAEYTTLYREGETRKTALSGPLTAGVGAGATP